MHKKPIDPKVVPFDPDAEAKQLKITRCVVDLHVARRTLLIYPITHEQVKHGIIRAFKGLRKILESETSLTLVVLKEGIRYCDQMLGTRNPALKDLAAVLKNYRIATVTFNKGLDIKELARFLQLICTDVEKVTARGGIVAAAKERHFSAIQLQAVDYSKLRYTAEDEIQRNSGKNANSGSIWQQFITNVLSSGMRQDNTSCGPMDPANLASMLNQKEIDADLVVLQYRSVLEGGGTSGFAESASAAELKDFQRLIKELDADLKTQFLSVTFDNWGPNITATEAARLIDGLGGDLIIQMIRQANARGKEISPSLMAFVKKMGHADAAHGELAKGEGEGEKPKQFSAQKVESLLAREQYDTYVDSGYGELLDNLTQTPQSSDRDHDTRTLVEEIETELTESKVNVHAGRAITRLMISSNNTTGYRDWARQLTYLLDDLLDSHAYGYLIQLIKLMRHEKRNKNKERAEIAALVLDRFSDPQVVAKAIESLKSSKGDPAPETLIFFMEIGEPVVVEIFDGLDPNQTFDEEGILTQILKNLAKLTVQEAMERLKEPNPDYVRRMVRIIRKMGDHNSAQQVRLLIDHDDFNVRMEALATLLSYENKWGNVRLKELLADPTGEAFVSATVLAGRYTIQSAVPQLEAVAMQRGEQDTREAAIRALGQIGDPRALSTLSKIARRRWGITQKHNRRLRRIIFETLEGYPGTAIQDLLRYGLKQKDQVIQAVSQRLLRRGGQTAIPNAS